MPVRHKAAAEAGYIWRKVTDEAAFPGRDGAGALVYDGKMWLIGGWNPGDKKTNPIHSNCNNEVWNSADGAAWSLVKPNSHFDDRFDPASDWEARHTAGYAVYRDKMWIIGGDPLLGHYQFDVWNSADGRTWDLHTKDVPWLPRVYHDVAVFDDKLWMMEGQHVPGSKNDGCASADVWFSADGEHWQELPAIPWARRHAASVFVFQNALWMVAGNYMGRDVWKLVRGDGIPAKS